MAELNPNIILAGAQAPAVPLNDLSSVYMNAQKFRAGQIDIADAETKQRQAQAINDAYKMATGPDGKVDPGRLQAALASGGVGTAIPGVQKANADVAHVNAQTAQANATSQATVQETLHKSLTLIDGSVASLAAQPNVNENMVVAEVGRLVNAGAFDVQAHHDGTTPDAYAKNLLSTMPVGNPAALKSWLVSAGMRAADAKTRLETMLPKYNEQDRGGVISEGTTNPLTGIRTDVREVKKTVTPDAALSSATQRRGQDMQAAAVKAQLEAQDQKSEVSPDQEEALAQMIAKRQMPPLSAYAVTKPSGMRIMARVSQIDPNFSGTDFGVHQSTEKNFAQGPLGNKVRSFNVALDHLETFSQLADALNNGNVQQVNRLSQSWAQQTGSPAPTNLDAAKQIVAKELVSMIVAGGGSDREREEAEHTLSRVNSPAQLKGVIDTYQRMGVGQLHGLEQQYQSGSGRNDFDTHLSPAARTVRQRLSPGASAGTAVPATQPAPAGGAATPRAGQGGRPSIDSFFKQAQ